MWRSRVQASGAEAHRWSYLAILLQNYDFISPQKYKFPTCSPELKRASEKREEPERGVSHSYSCADWLEGWLIGGARKAPTLPSPYWQFYSSSIDEEFSLAKTRTSIYV
ncbi:hypothetical protein E2C01_003936 [Portunus trituberculatus]|uniref:Uncharacterized protein n=1 Tax=Portunus trituberculatus TaxID=210409 RepID=A0A5B7CRI6_PORTR|nr:hypothetical protein [Portunus trituberculatus]